MFIQIPYFTCERRCPTGLLFAAVVAFTLVVLNAHVHAIVVQDHHRKLNGGRVDFGGGGAHTFGSPDGNGLIRFEYTISGGQLLVRARVKGVLYWDSLTNSGCARLTIRYRDINQSLLDYDEVEFCGPGGDANNDENFDLVDETFAHSALVYVRISVNEVQSGQLLTGTSTTVQAPMEKHYNLVINSGTADFGSGSHSFGIPDGDASIGWERNITDSDTGDYSTLSASVSGTLYWDALSPGCARVITDFRSPTASIISVPREVCGPGGNANLSSNQRGVSLGNSGGPLFEVKLQVGSLAGSSFVGVTTKTFNFSGLTGNFELLPDNVNVGVNETVNYAFTWNVPEPRNWHDLTVLQLRITDGSEIILWLLWDEASNSFSLYNERTRRFGRAFPAGSFAHLQTKHASLDLSAASVTPINSVFGSGPDSPSVLLNLPIRLKPTSAGRTLRVDVSANDDLGNEDPFAAAGVLTVSR